MGLSIAFSTWLAVLLSAACNSGSNYTALPGITGRGYTSNQVAGSLLRSVGLTASPNTSGFRLPLPPGYLPGPGPVDLPDPDPDPDPPCYPPHVPHMEIKNYSTSKVA